MEFSVEKKERPEGEHCRGGTPWTKSQREEMEWHLGETASLPVWPELERESECVCGCMCVYNLSFMYERCSICQRVKVTYSPEATLKELMLLLGWQDIELNRYHKVMYPRW